MSVASMFREICDTEEYVYRRYTGHHLAHKCSTVAGQCAWCPVAEAMRDGWYEIHLLSQSIAWLLGVGYCPAQFEKEYQAIPSAEARP